MTEQEIMSLLQEMKARSLSGGLSSSDRRFIEQYYERITFRPFARTSCGRCYNDAFIEMYTTLKKHGLRPMSKFRLCNGVVLQSARFKEIVTNANMTDQIALLWLKDNPHRIGLFSRYPENWKELIEQDEPQPQSSEETPENETEAALQTENQPKRVKKQRKHINP
ncbi:hypothetical protein M2132_000820 [Dysgonomonas sp. PH5-45]|uniref:hypothetical protein n=1 Tax=unclassified Dysgonomonas TaxID=2630389 RepID=UPI00247681C4|nr:MULTISPECIES: hypothetical protein [unclassified Dysgonomonas]MDH6354492.1 hypothetical protein [Dysgonomonas sp. PH5-45]MDH6387451.1 hypothetical protein [Dysgonomonas sp. PH5-37]